MCTNTTTGTLLIQLLRYQTFDTKINNLNLKIYIKIWNTHFFQWQHSALCPNKVLVPPQQVLCSHWWPLLQHLMNLREKKMYIKMYILQAVFLLCLLLLTLGCTGQWTTCPHLVHMSMWGCDDLFSSQHCSCPRLPRQSRLHFCSKISHNSISWSLGILSFFVSSSCFVSFHSCPVCIYMYVCDTNSSLPHSLVYFLPLNPCLSTACSDSDLH